jgi:hypothetical protein
MSQSSQIVRYILRIKVKAFVSLEEEHSMNCVNGHSNTEGARFCGTCGGAVIGMSASVTSNNSGRTSGPFFDNLKNGFIADLGGGRFSTNQTNLQTILSFVAGSLMAIAVFFFESEVASKSGAIAWAVVGIAVAYLTAKFVGPLISAGSVTLFIPMAAVLCLAIFENSISENKYGPALLVLGLLYLCAWVLPVLRARQSLLAASLVSLVSGFIALASASDVACSDSDWSCGGNYGDNLAKSLQSASSLALLFGLILLGAAWNFDRKDWPQLGRVFIGVGILYEVGGAYGVATSNSDRTGGAILLTLAGVALLVVAIRRDRKASLVIGGSGVIAGVTALCTALVSDGQSSTSAIFLLLFSIAFGYLAVKKSQLIQSKVSKLGQP